jgi:hypothetical protein
VKAKWETPVLLLGGFNDEPFDIAVIDRLQALQRTRPRYWPHQ